MSYFGGESSHPYPISYYLKGFFPGLVDKQCLFSVLLP